MEKLIRDHFSNAKLVWEKDANKFPNFVYPYQDRSELIKSDTKLSLLSEVLARSCLGFNYYTKSDVMVIVQPFKCAWE